MVRTVTGRDKVSYVYTVESYRDENGRPRQRTIAAHGRLDELLAGDPDALVKLRAAAAQASAARQGRRGTLEFDTAAPADVENPLNAGWLLVDAVLSRLGAGQVLAQAAKAGGWRVDAAEILTTLVAARVVWPGSKKASAQRAGRLVLGPGELDLGHVYQALDRIGAASLQLQQAASARLGRDVADLACVDYDVTNYFFHIDTPDPDPVGKDAPRGHASRRMGPSKENRKDPIIQMGLFCDAKGIPVCFRLFDGNVPDVSTMPAALAEFKAAFAPGRIVVVGDKAMNARNNLGALYSQADGWIVSESPRKATRELRAWLLDGEGWQWNTEHTFAHKSTLVRRTVPVTKWGVPDLPFSTLEKIVATWSAKRAERDRHTREDLHAGAQALAGDEARYRAANKRGPRKYVTSHHVDPATGEILDTRETMLGVDTARIEKDAQLEGYQMLRTTETTIPDLDLLARYHQLVQIEDAFRVTKTDLQARPVYVSDPLHIEAHFAICFLALLIIRLLQHWTGLPPSQLTTAIRGLQTIDCGHGIHKIARPAQWDLIDQTTGVNTNQAWATLADLRQWRRDLTKTAKTTRFTTPKTT